MGKPLPRRGFPICVLFARRRLLEGFGGREEEGRGAFAIPWQVLVAVDAPAVVEADVHPVLELEPVAAAEAVKGVVPAEFVGAPDLSAADPGYDAVAAVDFLAQLDLRLDEPFVAVAPFVVAAHAFHAAHLGVHVHEGVPAVKSA